MWKIKQKISQFIIIISFVAILLFSISNVIPALKPVEPDEIQLSDSINAVSIADYEIKYCEELMTFKLDQNYCCSYVKELYDCSSDANYLLCYDDNLNWYAIVNRISGDVLERRESSSPYDYYLDFKCYYLGFGNYFYLDGNNLVSIDGDAIFDINNLPIDMINNSNDLFNRTIENGTFKSKEEIQSFVQENESSAISLCGASNRNNTVYCDYGWYWICLMNALQQNQVKYEPNHRIGYCTFTKYNGDEYEDILFPINNGYSCGEVAATMLLQFYERNQILNTIPDFIYNDSYVTIPTTDLGDNINYTVAQRVHNEICIKSSYIGGGSTFTTIKDAINAFLADNGIYGISATSSVFDASVKSAINNDDPAILFSIPNTTGYVAHLYDNQYESKDVSSHAMLAIGYTKGWFGTVDEYICHAGWNEAKDSNYTYVKTFVSRNNIIGNVRIIH